MENIEFNDFGGPNKISNPPMQVYISKMHVDYLKKYNIETGIIKDSLDGFNMLVEVKAFNIIVDNGVVSRLSKIFKDRVLVQNKEKNCLYFSDNIADVTYK